MPDTHAWTDGTPVDGDGATWNALAAHLDELLEQPPEERAAWLARRTDLATGVAARLSRLLRADAWARHHALLEKPPRLNAAASALVSPAEHDRIGPFTLERQIGMGGMSEVWLASYTDRRMERRVALKLPHGLASGRAQAARFERERDILAALEHPHIARLYDAGVTETGRVWLAMEHVEGTPIDRYCDHHALTVAQRIAVFLQVVDAVHFAHRALVVHRDLKPTNVLVNERGEVRLLDFGVARLLEPADPGAESPTELDGGALTPAYAAPEQFLRGPITTATDVYSLGVLLNVLLTGVLPHRPRRQTRAAVEDAIVEGDIVAPSAAAFDTAGARRRGVSVRRLRALVAGDLDTIVRKALKRDPAERYASADALALDLQRNLRGEPITAMPDSVWYRTAKFVRRHRVGVTLVATTAMVVVAAGAVAFVQHLGAQEQRQQATAIKEFLADVLGESEASEATGPAGVTGRSIIGAGVARADARFARQPALHGELLVELGRLYARHGEKQLAVKTLERGAGLLETHAPDAVALLAFARAQLAIVLMPDAAGQERAQSLAARVLADCVSRDVACARARAPAERVAMHAHHARGELQLAIAAARRSLDEYRRAYGDADTAAAGAWEQLAIMLRNDGQYREARAAINQALALGAQNLRASHRRSLLLSSAVIAFDAGHYAEAGERFAALLRDHPEWTGPRASAARPRMLYAMVLGYQGLPAEATEQAEQGVALARAEANADIEAWSRQQHSRALSMAGRHEAAIAEARAALAHFERSAPGTRSEAPRRYLAEILARAGRSDQAFAVLADNLAHLRRLYPADHLQIAQSEDLLGAVARIRGDHATARELHERARTVLERRLEASHPHVGRNAAYSALNDYLAGGDPQARERAALALDAYAAQFPATSHWRQVADQARRRLDVEAPRAAGRLAGVVFAH
jgi:serine/threonine-protein kinase